MAYANHLVTDPSGAFLSEQVVAYTESLGQKIFGLCLIDLPFHSTTPLLTSNDRSLTLQSRSNTLVFYKQFQLGTTKLKEDILVS